MGYGAARCQRARYLTQAQLGTVGGPLHFVTSADAPYHHCGTLDLALQNDNPNHTLVNYVGDVQVGGPLVQVGQRVIDSAAKMLIGQFFAAAEAELKANAAGAVARQGFFINFWRYLLNLIRSLFPGGR